MAFLVFCVATVLGDKSGAILKVFLLLLVPAVIMFAPGSLEDRINAIFDKRMSSRLEVETGTDAVSRFQAVDAGRYVIWKRSAERIIQERPWVIPFGGGINSFWINIQVDSTAHNAYLTLIAEVGVLGLFLYLRWLWTSWREANRLSRNTRGARGRGSSRFSPSDMKALILAMAVSLFAGEIVSPVRPAFTFMGMLLFVYGVLTHPALVFGPRFQASNTIQTRQRVMPRPRLQGGAAAWK